MSVETLIADLLILAPEITLAVGAMALLVYGAFAGEDSTGVVSTGSVVVIIMAGSMALFSFSTEEGLAFVDAQGRAAFVSDAWARFAKVIIAGVGAAVLVLSSRFLHEERIARFEYPILVVLAVLGMMIMVSSRDLLALYMGVELQSLSLYVLAAFHRDSVKASESGLKYFVLGALSSGILLYGISLVYGFAGDVESAGLVGGQTRFEGIAAATEDGANLGIIFGLVFIICGMAFKVSAAPFHMWTPDVYQGAPTPATMLFASAPKFAAMALFARLLLEAFPHSVDDWQMVMALIAAASITVGAFGALVQTNIKRLMAYSSIANMGFALTALAAGNERGMSGLLIYMAIYVISTTGVFACILAMRRREGATEAITDLAGISRTHPGLAWALTALLFSIAGIPPLAGFFGKLFAFSPAWEAGANAEFMYWLVIYAVVISVIAAVYYLRLVKIVWFDEAERPLSNAGRELVLIASATAVFVSPLLLVFASDARQIVDGAARALFF